VASIHLLTFVKFHLFPYLEPDMFIRWGSASQPVCRNFRTSKAPLKIQAQGTSLFKR